MNNDKVSQLCNDFFPHKKITNFFALLEELFWVIISINTIYQHALSNKISKTIKKSL
jgi:hypothetical protein